MYLKVTVHETEIRLTVYSNRTACVYKNCVTIVTNQKVTIYEIDVVSSFHFCCCFLYYTSRYSFRYSFINLKIRKIFSLVSTKIYI